MLKLQIASVFYREHWIVEILNDNTIIAEINREKGIPEIEFYTKLGESFNLADFFEILEQAKEEISKHT